MTSTQQTAGSPQPNPDPMPSIPPPPRKHRGRRTAAIVGIGVLLSGGLAIGAVAFGISTASALLHETTTQSVPGVQEIVLDLDEGAVRLAAASGAEVEVRTTRAWTPGYEPVLTEQTVGGVLTLTSDCASFNLGCEVTREIGVPSGTAVRVRAGAASVAALDLDTPRFDVATGAGPVTASFVTAPDALHVSTVAGPIDVRVPQGAYRVTADAVVGQVRVDVVDDPTAARTIDLDTVTGPVTVVGS